MIIPALSPMLHCLLFFFLLLLPPLELASVSPKVVLGIDMLLKGTYGHLLKNKRVGILANHTSVNGQLENSVDLLIRYSKQERFTITAFFAPEHGLSGSSHASAFIEDGVAGANIPVYSLHGKTKRPTKEMLDRIDVLIFDIQDIGSRSYTYVNTLFFAMEEAAKWKKRVIVLDRPNPINGITVDGPMLHDPWRSIVGYINVPYCHGMTVGELARFFNEEYRIGCDLHVISMEGWDRRMTFADTGLTWLPTSPQIPEDSTPWFYPATGILGELQIVSIGVGYTLPFKIVGAPWIDGERFAKHLNDQKLPGVRFHPFHFQPFFGKFAKEECHGVLISITDHSQFLPVTTQYVLIGILKSLYPAKFQAALQALSHRKEMFCKVNGNEEIYRILKEEPYVAWRLRSFEQKERGIFLENRKKYLNPNY